MAKNIVIFCDGTGQDGGTGPNTNVYKLFNMIEDRTPRQIAFYDPGLGTGILRVMSMMTGMGISRNIKECYRFIFDNYEAGDQIYLFGFSRGAATVRSLSSFIHHFGLLPESRPGLIEEAFGIYRKMGRSKRMKAKADEFLNRHHTMWVRIKFLGVWDTVAALGMPSKALDRVVTGLFRWLNHKFHDLRLSESVENAYQALSIDDERATFHPEIWDTEVKPYQTVKQVWFCGMHTDVGGGYETHALSDIPLEWMVINAEKQGLHFYKEHTIKVAPDPNGIMENSRKGKWAWIYPRRTRFWPESHKDLPVIHASVLKRKKNGNNVDQPPYDPWIMRGSGKPMVEPWIRWKKWAK